MGQLRAFLLFLSLIGLISLASCGTLNLNTTTITTTKAATPLPTTEPTFTAGSSTLRTAEPTVTIEPQTAKAAGSTKTFPSSTTLTSTTSTTAKPLLILTTTTTSTTTSTTNTSSPAPWFIEEEKDFADDLLQAQAPIEAKLPTSGCKAAAFSSVLSSAAASPANGGDGILAGPSSLPRREKIFVRVPSERCPPEITRKAIAELNNLRHCQGLAEMAHSEALAAEAGRWAAETATQGVVYKPGYSGAGQYATSTAAPYAVFSLDLSGFEVLGKWKGSGNNYLPWFTGSGTAPRHFTNDEWRRVREFGVGCAAYRFRTAKAMFWTVVFFRKA